MNGISNKRREKFGERREQQPQNKNESCKPPHSRSGLREKREKKETSRREEAWNARPRVYKQKRSRNHKIRPHRVVATSPSWGV